MVVTRLRPEQLEQLADDVHDKILSNQDTVADAEGEIRIRIIRRGPGFKIILVTGR
jgi:hypothetical protein